MNYSYEEIYWQCGQYDQVAIIIFPFRSQAYNDFGERLVGKFKYTFDERIELETLFKSEVNQRSDKMIKIFPFPPSSNNLSIEQCEKLGLDGFLCSDIRSLKLLALNDTNRFTISEQKEVPNLIKIKVDLGGWDIKKMYYDLQGSKTENGLNLSQKAEEENFLKIDHERLLNRLKVVKKELGKTQYDTLIKKDPHYLNFFHSICNSFGSETETLSLTSFPIWWDFERYIHIYFHHVNLFNDLYNEKTYFQYESKYIKNIIKIILHQLNDQIQEHFSNGSSNKLKKFFRIGKQAAYYDGVYYRVEVEPSGRLFTFHPYNQGTIKGKSR